MKLFLGEYSHGLDEKERLTLPKKIRLELMDESVILSRGFEHCIFGFDRESWNREAQKNLEISVRDEKGRSIRRYLFAAAEKVDIDKLGRILMPARLKEYAHINKEIVVVGAGDHFEIWEPSTWQEYIERIEKNLHE